MSLRRAPSRLSFRHCSDSLHPRETAVAEKLEAIVQLGTANSRMKDFYDIVALATSFEFDGQPLLDAIRATFKRRGTPIPEQRPIAFTSIFTTDPSKTMQWAAFVKKSGVERNADLGSTVASVAAFLEEPLGVARTADPFTKHWSAKRGWD